MQLLEARFYVLFCGFIIGSTATSADDDYSKLVRNFIDTHSTCSKLQENLSKIDAYLARGSEPHHDLAATRLKPTANYFEGIHCFNYTGGKTPNYDKIVRSKTPSAQVLKDAQLLTLLFNPNDAERAIDKWNAIRKSQSLKPLLWGNYRNSIDGGNSTVLLVQGSIDNPDLHEWLQIQRSLSSVFFLSLDKSETPSRTYVRASHFSGGTLSDSPTHDIGNNCYQCHTSGKPLRMFEPLTDDKQRISQLNDILSAEGPSINPFNPRPDFPGIGMTKQDPVELTHCASCHDGNYKDALTLFGGRIFNAYLTKKVMPPNTHHINWDRQKLKEVLYGDFKTNLRKYLEGE